MGRRYTRHYHAATRHDVCRSNLEGGEPRSALRPVRRLRAEPNQRADEDPWRAAGCKRARPVARLLRQGFTGFQFAARQWDALGFDEAAFLGAIGLAQPSGEAGRPALERLWARPTADINGIWGGYTGAGSKTVIASEATAKVSFRLVPNQDPNEVMEQFKRFVTDRLPPDATASFADFSRAPGIEVNVDSPHVHAALAALSEEYGRPALLMGSGGSIPVVTSLRSILGVDSLLMGFGLDDDQVHSPNEKFEESCFHHGIRSHARLLAKFAGG